MSLGAYESCVVHLLPLFSDVAVTARILLRSSPFLFLDVIPRTATSPALPVLLPLPGCPALALVLLLLLERRCPVFAMLLLLLLLLRLLPGSPVHNTNFRRVTSAAPVVSGVGKGSVTTGPTMRRTINPSTGVFLHFPSQDVAHARSSIVVRVRSRTYCNVLCRRRSPTNATVYIYINLSRGLTELSQSLPVSPRWYSSYQYIMLAARRRPSRRSLTLSCVPVFPDRLWGRTFG